MTNIRFKFFFVFPITVLTFVSRKKFFKKIIFGFDMRLINVLNRYYDVSCFVNIWNKWR